MCTYTLKDERFLVGFLFQVSSYLFPLGNATLAISAKDILLTPIKHI